MGLPVLSLYPRHLIHLHHDGQDSFLLVSSVGYRSRCIVLSSSSAVSQNGLKELFCTQSAHRDTSRVAICEDTRLCVMYDTIERGQLHTYLLVNTSLLYAHITNLTYTILSNLLSLTTV